MVIRRVLWVLLCLVAGGPCAFLALEGIGAPIIALPYVVVSVQERELVSAGYFAAQLAVAGAIVLSGCWMLLSREASAPH